MATARTANRSPDDTKTFERLVRTVQASGNLPELIQRIGSEADLLGLCRTLAAITPQEDSTAWSAFENVCRRHQAVPTEIAEKIRIAMGSLGHPYRRRQPDHYAVLDLPKTASAGDIRRAYRKKAKIHHPDMGNGDHRDTEAFVRLNEAYFILRDPALRRHYDDTDGRITRWQERSDPVRPQAAAAGHAAPGLRPFLIFIGIMLVLVVVSLVFSVFDQQRSLQEGLQVRTTPDMADSPVNRPVPDQPAATGGTVNGKPEQAESAFHPTMPRLPDPEDGTGVAANAMPGQNDPIPPVETDPRTTRQAHGGRPASRPVAATSGQVEAQQKDPGDQDPGARQATSSENSRYGAGSTITVSSVKELAAGPTNEAEHRNPTPDRESIPLSAFMKDRPGRPSAENDSDSEQDADTVHRPGDGVDARENTPFALLPGMSVEDATVHRVHAFFNRYRDAFERKNIEEFERFFTPDAVENGRPFSSITDQYKRIFLETNQLTYELDLHSYAWLIDQQRLRTKGTFKISSLPHGDSRWQTRKGSIAFDLVMEQGEYRVQRIDFTLNN